MIFAILAILTVASATAAVALRNLVHCALALAAAFTGLAAIYLLLNAQFVGFAQLLVYVGAVAILIVFAVLLTRGGDPGNASTRSRGWLLGGAIAAAVFALLAFVILSSRALPPSPPAEPQVTVRDIGDKLVTDYILPFEAAGLLLTAALIGAVILALPSRRGDNVLK